MAIERRAIHRILSFSPVIVDAFATGVNSGWLAPVLKNSESPTYEITLTSDERSWIASLSLLFMLCGLILCIFTVDKFGRKKILFCDSLLYLIGWTVVRFTKSVDIIYVSRIILGIETGLTGLTVIILIGESSLPTQRGVYGSIVQMFAFGGTVTEYVLATYCAYYTVATVNLVIGLLYFSSIFMMKESVPFLIAKGRHEEAWKHYKRLFSEDTNEFETLKHSIETSTRCSLSLKEFVGTPAFYKSIALATSLTFLMYLTGYMTLQTYSSFAFSSSALLSPNEFTICFGLIQIAASFGSSFYIDRFSRRSLLLSALALSTLINLAAAALYYTQEHLTPIPQFPWLIFTTISSFSVVASVGMQPVLTALRSELFPQKIKPAGIAITGVAGFLSLFVASFTFLKISDTFGIYTNFLCFSAMCSVTFAFAYFFVPETRGKSLSEIQRMFEKGKAECSG